MERKARASARAAAERARAGGDADEVEQVAVLAAACVGPLPRRAGGREADEERAASGAADVAGDPVAALLAALRQVSPADLLGARGEGGGDGGGVHGAPPARMTPSPEAGRRIGSGSMRDLSRGCRGSAPVPAPLRLLEEPGTAGDARSASRAVRPGAALNRLHKKRPTPRGRNAAPAQVSGRERPAKSFS